LFPHSDIDVLILRLSALDTGTDTAAIERFIGMLWDAGLEVAHSVRTIEQCETEMAHDITIRTSLLERRLLCGSSLRERCRRFESVSTSACVFDAKALEQQQRHLRYQDTAATSSPTSRKVRVKLARPADDHLDRHVPGQDHSGARWRRLDDRRGSARGRPA
jgi:[protein-PII] uridylyltransferase